MAKPKGATSYRFSDEGQALLARLAEVLGMPKTYVLELAIRRLARAELPAAEQPANDRPPTRPMGRPRKAPPPAAGAKRPKKKGAD
jgi:hypothetical protein